MWPDIVISAAACPSSARITTGSALMKTRRLGSSSTATSQALRTRFASEPVSLILPTIHSPSSQFRACSAVARILCTISPCRRKKAVSGMSPSPAQQQALLHFAPQPLQQPLLEPASGEPASASALMPSSMASSRKANEARVSAWQYMPAVREKAPAVLSVPSPFMMLEIMSALSMMKPQAKGFGSCGASYRMCRSEILTYSLPTICERQAVCTPPSLCCPIEKVLRVEAREQPVLEGGEDALGLWLWLGVKLRLPEPEQSSTDAGGSSPYRAEFQADGACFFSRAEKSSRSRTSQWRSRASPR
mmetsp:Transcript_12409/g.41159  ORF Transcript_12409/g.41159 Transcript_12409/m.41159 type:complete len:304 (-) Transcript_12409:104-1015(-)